MQGQPTILVVQDDADLPSQTCAGLSRAGFAALAAAGGAGLRAAIADTRPALVVLDVTQPGADGLTLLRELRRQSALPAILLTTRADPLDRVIGLELGADDYLSQPVEPRELVARIRTVLRRAGANASQREEVMRFDGWELTLDSRRLLSPEGALVPLSNAEFRLLATFLKRPRRIFSREQLSDLARDRVGDSAERNLDRSIDLLVSRLRQKLADDPREPRLIRTVRGAGYVFNAPAAHVSTPVQARNSRCTSAREDDNARPRSEAGLHP